MSADNHFLPYFKHYFQCEFFCTNFITNAKNSETMERHKQGVGGFLILEDRIKLTWILHMTVFLDICNELDNSGSYFQYEL